MLIDRSCGIDAAATCVRIRRDTAQTLREAGRRQVEAALKLRAVAARIGAAVFRQGHQGLNIAVSARAEFAAAWPVFAAGRVRAVDGGRRGAVQLTFAGEERGH